jgi:uncharacterized repeat protein (TIGR04076 family)
MASQTPKCRVTVLKKVYNKDLIDEYLDTSQWYPGPCERFEVGQEFEVDLYGMPQDLCDCCPFAWADIRHDIMTVACGGDMPGLKQAGTALSGCRDWFRPVIFKVERLS